MANRLAQTQLLTAPMPTLATEGLALDAANGIRIMARANSGATLTDVNFWVLLWDATWQEWIHNPQLDRSQVAHNERYIVFPDLAIFVQEGRVAVRSVGSTVSAGTTLETMLQLW